MLINFFEVYTYEKRYNTVQKLLVFGTHLFVCEDEKDCPKVTPFYNTAQKLLIIETHLFVCEDEKDCFPEFVLCQHPHQFVSGFADSLAIVRVDNENQTWKFYPKYLFIWTRTRHRIDFTDVVNVFKIITLNGNKCFT